MAINRRHLMRSGSVFAHLHMSGIPAQSAEAEAAAEKSLRSHLRDPANVGAAHTSGLAFYHSVQQAGGLQQLTMASLRRTAGHTRNK